MKQTDSRNLMTMKRKTQMLNIGNSYRKKTQKYCRPFGRGNPDIKLDLDNVNGHLALTNWAYSLRTLAVTEGNLTEIQKFFKKFYGPVNRPTIFLEKIDSTLEYQHLAVRW